MTLLFAVIPGIGILGTAYYVLKTFLNFHRLKEQGIESKGIITEFKTIKSGDKESYRPTIQFKTYAGIEIIGYPLRFYNVDEYISVAKEIEVIYLASNPKTFITKGQKFDYSSILIVSVMLIAYPFITKILLESDPNWLDDFKHFFDKF